MQTMEYQRLSVAATIRTGGVPRYSSRHSMSFHTMLVELIAAGPGSEEGSRAMLLLKPGSICNPLATAALPWSLLVLVSVPTVSSGHGGSWFCWCTVLVR